MKVKTHSSGTLLYRGAGTSMEILLVHASGAYNARSPWSIPKGIPDAGESLEAAARRETWEETGVTAEALAPLGSIIYTKSRKEIHCFAGPAPTDCQPTCASWEVDRAEFVTVAQARKLLHPEQQPFLDRLEDLLESKRSI